MKTDLFEIIFRYNFLFFLKKTFQFSKNIIKIICKHFTTYVRKKLNKQFKSLCTFIIIFHICKYKPPSKPTPLSMCYCSSSSNSYSKLYTCYPKTMTLFTILIIIICCSSIQAFCIPIQANLINFSLYDQQYAKKPLLKLYELKFLYLFFTVAIFSYLTPFVW